MFAKSLENSLGSIMMESKSTIGVNAKVVHVDLEPSFCDHI